MGTFVGHILPGLAMVLLGIWHTINTINDYYLKGSPNFVSTFWYPFKCPLSKLKHLELLLILSFSIFAICMEVLDYPFFCFSFKLDNFEHATMFLHLAIFAGFTLCAELTHSSDILSGISGVLAVSVFGQELFLLHYHSADHVGLEGHYHWLLQLIVFVSLVACVSSTSFPASFPAALVLTISVVFQGFWFINMGFMLWVPEFIPRGCVVARLGDAGTDNMQGAVMCQTQEASVRAMALANMQFSWILAGIMIFTSCVTSCITYILSCITKHSSQYKVLMLGRVLGGIATSLLFSAFESWLVAEHNKRGFDQQWLSLTFSKAILLGNGLVAILSGLFGNLLVDLFSLGPVAPFDAAACFLAIGI